MIVSGGENVYPVEVEEALAQHPGVAEVTVIGVPDERWGETVKALVVPAPPAPPSTAEELIAFARERLAGYKLPRTVDFVGRPAAHGLGQGAQAGAARPLRPMRGAAGRRRVGLAQSWSQQPSC